MPKWFKVVTVALGETSVLDVERKGKEAVVKTVNIQQLLQAGEARPVQLDRHKLLEHVAVMFDRMGLKKFKTIPDVEGMTAEELRALPTEGSVLEPITEFLRSAGIPSDGTVGSVMDRLGLSHGHVHRIACWCHTKEINNIAAASRIRDIAQVPSRQLIGM